MGYDSHRMRIAVLGLGFMGSTHIQALQTIPEVTLAAVFTRDPKKLSGDLSAVQGNIGGPGRSWDFSGVRQCSQIEEVLEDPNIDAVDICLPTDLHAAVAMEALRAGKDVLIEKPMTLDVPSARRLVTEAAERNRVLMTAQVLRFMPPYRALIGALDDGQLGTVRHATFRRRCAAPAWSGWLADPKHSGGGVFDLLIHDVDIALKLFGSPALVSAVGFEDLARGIDVITGEFHYPGQGTAVIAGGWHHARSYPFSMEYTVVADHGTIEYSSQGREPTLYAADGAAAPLPLDATDGYRAELAYFVECCATRRRPHLCPPEDSSAAVALTHLLLEARNRNGERIPCNL